MARNLAEAEADFEVGGIFATDLPGERETARQKRAVNVAGCSFGYAG